MMNELRDCVAALSRRRSVESDSDYKGFMKPTAQHLLHQYILQKIEPTPYKMCDI